ncbi:MAG: LysR family transcriptional regulator [Eubacterium sp.]|nr:LysR family transcriptional regulator [Eubacterium sp.]
MTIIQLRYFNAVCQYLNITRAAEALQVSQPAVSNAIRDLEEELSVKLFYRVKKKMAITKEGEFFLDKSMQIVSAVDNLSASMKEMAENSSLIRIGISPIFNTLYFPQIISSFRSQYPSIKLSIEECGSLDCRAKVLNNELDLAIAVTNDITSPRLNTRDIISTRLVYVVSKKHPLAGHTVINVEDIGDSPMILSGSGSYSNALINNLFKSRGMQPNVILYSDQVTSVLRMLQGGIAGAVTYMGFSALDDDLVEIPFAQVAPYIRVGLVEKQDEFMYSDMTEFIDFIKFNYDKK